MSNDTTKEPFAPPCDAAAGKRVIDTSGHDTPGAISSASLKIIASADDHDFINRFISALRKTGCTVSVSMLEYGDSLMQATSRLAPDLILVLEDNPGTAQAVIDTYLASENAVPLLLAASGTEKLAGRSGRVTVIPRKAMPMLVLTAWHLGCLYRERLSNASLSRQVLALEKQQQRILETSPIATTLLNDGRHIYCNRSYLDLLGCGHDKSLKGVSLTSLVTQASRDKLIDFFKTGPEGRTELTLTVGSGDERRKLSFLFSRNGNHGPGHMLVEARPARGNRRYSREKLAQARRDLITRLENLPFFTTRIESAIASAIEGNTGSILLIARIDRFRQVEKQLGKAATNQTLNDISEYLKKAINKPFTASRLADDEFGLFLANSSPEEGLKLARYISDTVNKTLSEKQTESVTLSISIGLASINRHALDADDMINRARINIGMPLDHTGASTNDINRCLKKALEQRQFSLRFQPILAFHDRGSHHFDITVRLDTENGDCLRPGTFLPHAIIHNLGNRIDRIVLNILFSRYFNTVGPDTYFHITLNSNTLANLSLLSWLSKQLQKRRLQASQLVFQITEIDLHSNPEQVMIFCSKLHELGAGIILTHFGSAMQPLPVLKKLRPAMVRLDAALLENLQYSRQDQDRVRKFVQAIHQENARVSVSGIDDMTLLPLFHELGIDAVQGDCIQEPVNSMSFPFPVEEVVTLPH